MNAALSWLKGNVLTVICIVVIVVSLASFYFPIYTRSKAFRAEMGARASELSTIENMKQTIEVPSPRANEAPLSIQMVITEPAIKKLNEIYSLLNRQYVTIVSETVKRNRTGKRPFMPNLFPQPLQQDTPFLARSEYLKAFINLGATLNGGMPPDPLTFGPLLADVDYEYRNSRIPALTTLTPDQQTELAARQAMKLVNLFRQRAEEIQIYAGPVDLNLRDKWSPGPFQVKEWPKAATKPFIYDIWEGQMQYWIQQDIVRAIRNANNIRTLKEGEKVQAHESVIYKPVKRLVKISIQDDRPGVGFFMPYYDESLGGTAPTVTPPPVNPDESIAFPDHFGVALTGRQTGALYDVRHATLDVWIDANQIPRLLNAINDTNFMTVIGMTMQDLDDYTAIQGGYYFGESIDVVQLTMKIETIWMRHWTAGHISPEAATGKGETFNPGLMPDQVRFVLGLKPRAADFVPSARAANAAGAGFSFGEDEEEWEEEEEEWEDEDY